MKRILMGSIICLAGALAMTACSGLKTVVSTVGGAVYSAAADAVTDYCSLSDAQRAVAQLVVAGKVYNTGVCKVVNADKGLVPVLAVLEPEKVPAALDAAISAAVSSGELSQHQADAIKAPPTTTPTPAVVPEPTQATPSDEGVTTARLHMRRVYRYA